MGFGRRVLRNNLRCIIRTDFANGDYHNAEHPKTHGTVNSTMGEEWRKLGTENSRYAFSPKRGVLVELSPADKKKMLRQVKKEKKQARKLRLGGAQ